MPLIQVPHRGSPDSPRRGASFGLAATLLANPGVVALLAPGLAAALFTAEFTLILLVMTASVFSPRTTSDRAFRLLRWMTGHPEPHHPVLTSGNNSPDKDH
jgi:hypothetical protein